jgi:ribosomal protein L9
VRLPAGPLRTVGEHAVQIHLHADVDLELPVIIVAEEAG